ncbi:hypothetical protein [Nocardia brasiliensis]|uniref:hypothetical protein n=1 Tax=Nocardia brasiliensis TaxID=37326 RepID=UPI0024550333|nr:hypothetical protein [Nocardia brasiliensis]
MAVAPGGGIVGWAAAGPIARALAAVGGLLLLYLETGALIAGLVALSAAIGVTLLARRRTT